MRFSYRLIFVVSFLAVIARSRIAHASAPYEIDVILWFDTEDYLLPADDDADKRLAELLTQRHIRATFKVVGEKARVLEKRGRQDVIDALRKHEIGYHANFHSVHPAPAEYLADCGLLDGIQEFVRREGRGAEDVRRIFHVPSLVCYGQPGSSWAPQAMAALGACGIANNGIPCYVDSGHHVGVGGVPFWYDGTLTVYDIGKNETRMDLWAEGGLERGQKAFAAIAQRLASESGGLISIYYHPCEWVHQEFWDSVNFKRGANPPRELWKPPRQRAAEQTDAAFARFAQYIDFIRNQTGLKFITAHDLPDLYPDPVRSDGASQEQVADLAKRILSPQFSGLDDVKIGETIFSPADQFALLAFALGSAIDHSRNQSVERPSSIRIPPGLLGPDASPPEPATARKLPWLTFRDTLLDVRDFLQMNRRMPPRVFIGADAIPPADFVPAMAEAFLHLQDSGRFPDSVSLGSGIQVLTMDHVIKDSPGVYGGWIIHKEGFRAPKLLDLARLQAWTLKPATRAATH